MENYIPHMQRFPLIWPINPREKKCSIDQQLLSLHIISTVVGFPKSFLEMFCQSRIAANIHVSFIFKEVTWLILGG